MVARADRRLLSHAREAWPALAADVALGVLDALLVLAQAVLVGTIVAAAFGGAGPRSLVAPFLFLLGAVVGRSIARCAFETVGRVTATRVVSGLRLEIARNRLQSGAHRDERAADLATLMVEGADALEALFAQYVPQLILAVAIPVAAFGLIAYLDLLSAALILLTVPVAIVFMWLLGHAAVERNRERWQTLAVLAAHFSDVVRGLPTLRAFNRGTFQAGRITEVSDAYRRATMETLRVSFLSGAVLDLAGTLGVALIAVTIGVRLIDGSIHFAPGLIVLLLAPELYAPVRNLGALYHVSAQGRAVADRLLDLAAPQITAHSTPAPAALGATLRFDDVWFAYGGRTAHALEGVDFAIDPGEMVALVGESGAGKTTVVALLLLLLEPQRGHVLVGDADLHRCDAAAWRKQISWVPQRPSLVRGTVADNIRVGRGGATDAQVRAACRSACADEFVSRLPHGYDTVVGDGGRPLSAGELHRLALARAFLREAALLILDEPTAHLDQGASESVLATLETRHGSQTILLISHHDELAAAADRVIRLDAGRIVPAESRLATREVAS